jgi:hypothetical protein
MQMNVFRLTGIARLFAAVTIVAGLLAVHAVGQGTRGKTRTNNSSRSSGADIVTPPVKTTFDPAQIEQIKKKTRAFKALQLTDPKTKKKLADTQQVTTPSGKKMQAKAYVAELNKLEKKLNAIGYSLSDKGDKVLLSRSRINTADLDKKTKQIAASHAAFNPKTMKPVLKQADLIKRFKDRVKNDAPRVSALKKASGTPAKSKSGAGTAPGTVKKFHFELGQRNIVAISLDARLETKATKSSVSVLGDAEADGFLAGKKLVLLHATGQVNVPDKGDGKGSVTVTVAGRTVFNKDFTVPTNLTKKDQVSKSFDQSVSFSFSVGPFPLSVKLGAQGKVGLQYVIGVRQLSAEAQFEPFAQGSAYAQLAIDLVVASAGVRGKLNLIDARLTIGASLDLKADPSGGLVLDEHAYVSSDLTLLQGEVTVFVEVNLIFTKKTFEHTLWKSNGIKKSGFLLNQSRTIPIT